MWYFVYFIIVHFLVVLLEHLQYADFWLHECVTQAVALCCWVPLKFLLQADFTLCYFPWTGAVLHNVRIPSYLRVSSRYLCSYEAMLLCFTTPSQHTQCGPKFPGLNFLPLSYQRHLPDRN